MHVYVDRRSQLKKEEEQYKNIGSECILCYRRFDANVKLLCVFSFFQHFADDKAVLVDYDLTAINYAENDISWYFVMHCGKIICFKFVLKSGNFAPNDFPSAEYES